MKNMLLVLSGVALSCALTSCTTSTFISATKQDGTEVKRVRNAPGTQMTTSNGESINSTGNGGGQQE